jgi:hypothetical protein
MKTKNIGALLSIAVLFGFMPMAESATLVSYDFPSGALAPTTSASNTITGNYLLGVPPDGLVAASTSSNVYYQTGTDSAADSSSSLAITNNFYSAFTITPSSGFALNLSTLSFNYGGTTPPLESFTANFFIRSSIDGFAADIGTTFSMAIPVNQTTPTYNVASIDLSGSDFQSLSAAVTFRLYAFGTSYSTSPSAQADRPRIDTINLSGTVVVIPEPSSVELIVLVGCGGLVGLWLRRRLWRGRPRQLP